MIGPERPVYRGTYINIQDGRDYVNYIYLFMIYFNDKIYKIISKISQTYFERAIMQGQIIYIIGRKKIISLKIE